MLPLEDLLRGTTLDVLIVPAVADISWHEGLEGEDSSIGGFVGATLADVALRGGFRINIYLVRHPDGSAEDPYGGSFTAFIEDWAPRADVVGNFWVDMPVRRSLGLEYLASFYRLDLTLVSKAQTAGESGDGRPALNFSFLEPFGWDLWLAILASVLLVGLIERYAPYLRISPHISPYLPVSGRPHRAVRDVRV